MLIDQARLTYKNASMPSPKAKSLAKIIFGIVVIVKNTCAPRRRWTFGRPIVLVIHLKRFKYTRYSREKIDRVVDFPLEGLDLSKWIANPALKGTDACIYDLFGISQHMGGLGGGHYTALVKNVDDNKFYNCNDSSANQCRDPESEKANSAYVLFFKRRNPQNGPRVLEQLNAQFAVPQEEAAAPAENTPEPEVEAADDLEATTVD